jgi:hypothetical protein
VLPDAGPDPTVRAPTTNATGRTPAMKKILAALVAFTFVSAPALAEEKKEVKEEKKVEKKDAKKVEKKDEKKEEKK